jgi:6-phosphogluconolactonase
VSERVVDVVADPAAAVARRLVEVATAGGHAALSGGSTPRRAYELAAAAGGDWSPATLWYGDERCVPPDDERSNHRMVRGALLDRLPEPARPVVQRIEGERGHEAAAPDYEARLRAALGPRPVLDLALLGLGSDGHTASLFPAKPEIEERERLVVPVPEAGLEPFVPRVSLTLPVFDAAREVIFLVEGAGKAEAVARAFGPNADPALPAARVAPANGVLRLVLDSAAAAGLR